VNRTASLSVLARLTILPLLFAAQQVNAVDAVDAVDIVKRTYDYWREASSLSVVEITVHRPSWSRSMTIRVWTKGRKESLARIEAPAKDIGSGTLIVDQDMWSYSPKINQIVKVPSSMMAQSWMGSDFSNMDVTKAGNIADWYSHKLIANEHNDGKPVHVIESIPRENYPVVWGKEIMKIRSDYIILEHLYYDQDMKLTKHLITSEISTKGGKSMPTRQRMTKADKPNEWTEIFTRNAEFNIALPGNTFTLSNLRNQR
jgi:outer membrane lipoprotein-sorting protein